MSEHLSGRLSAYKYRTVRMFGRPNTNSIVRLHILLEPDSDIRTSDWRTVCLLILDGLRLHILLGLGLEVRTSDRRTVRLWLPDGPLCDRSNRLVYTHCDAICYPASVIHRMCLYRLTVFTIIVHRFSTLKFTSLFICAVPPFLLLFAIFFTCSMLCL